MRPLAEDEFAVRFTEKDLEGWFTKEVQVREGSLALLFQDGRLERVLTPGKYTLSSFWQGLLRRGPRKEVALVLSGEVPLAFTLPNLLTADPLFLNLECTAVLQLQHGQEQLFYTNLMREKDRVTLLDLRSLLFPSLRDAAATWFGQRTLEGLVASPDRGDLAFKVEDAVHPLLQRNGLRVLRVDPANPSCAAWNEKTRLLAEALQEVWRAEGELERRRKLFEVKQQVELQEIQEETGRLATFTRRADLWERLRQAFNTAEMSRLQSEQELEDFVRQVDRDKLLKEEDFRKLKATLEANRQDEEKARAHLVRTAELERDYEYKTLELRKRKDLTTAEVDFQQGLERLRLQGEHDLERMRLDLQVERSRKEVERRLAERTAEEAARRAAELEDARTQAQVRGLEREARRLDEELRLTLKEQEMAMQRADQAERQRLELEELEKQQELHAKREREQLDNHLRELSEQHQQEMERLTQLGQMPLHVLVAVSDPARAPILADLAALEMKKGMSYQQILALAVEKDPRLASYFGPALLQKATSEEEQRLYERIIAEQKDFQAKQSEFYRENLDRQERMSTKAMDSLVELARVLGGGRVPQGQPAPTPGSQSAGPVCPRCQSVSRPGMKYCANCGKSLTRDEERPSLAMEQIFIDPSAAPLLTETDRATLLRLFMLLQREAERNLMSVTKVEVSSFVDPEDDTEEVVVTQWVKASSHSALEYWDKLGATIEVWSDGLPEALKSIAVERLSIEVEWENSDDTTS